MPVPLKRKSAYDNESHSAVLPLRRFLRCCLEKHLVGLAGSEIDAISPKVSGAGRLRHAAEHLFPPGNFEIQKSNAFHQGFQLCFQQSASDSTSP